MKSMPPSPIRHDVLNINICETKCRLLMRMRISIENSCLVIKQFERGRKGERELREQEQQDKDRILMSSYVF